jgi:hypothetical protein
MPAIGGLNFQPNPPSAVSGFGNQAYQQFQYTAQVNNTLAAQNGTFTFPVPSMGYVWIGTFMPCVPQTVSATALTEAVTSLAYTTWQINRNGQAVTSWIGYTTLTNFQANATDVITVTGFNLPAGPVTLTWIGYAYATNLAPPVLPGFQTSGPPQGVIQPANIIRMEAPFANATSFSATVTITSPLLLVGMDMAVYQSTPSTTEFNAENVDFINQTTNTLILRIPLIGTGAGAIAAIVSYPPFPILLSPDTYEFFANNLAAGSNGDATLLLYVIPY